MAIDPGLLNQLMNNYSGSELGDQIQMAKFRQSQGGVASPISDVPVQSQNLAPPRMMGDGSPVMNKGVQVASADTTSPTPMSSIIDKAAGDEVSARASFEGVTPGVKPTQTTNQVRRANPNARGAVASPSPSMMPEKQPAPTAESLAAQRGRGAQDPLIAAIMRLLTQNQLKMPTGTGQQRPSGIADYGVPPR